LPVRRAAMNEEQLVQAVQAGKKGGKKASEALDQKLAKAVRDGQSAADVAALINAVHAKGMTVLHRACENADPDTLQVLLKHGGDPNALAKDGATPLLLGLSALGRGGREDPPTTKPVVKKYERLCGVLLQHPTFDRQASDAGGPMASSPVFLCVREDFGRADALLPLLKLLLARGFDPSGWPRRDDAPSDAPSLPALHMAVNNGHFKCAAALVEAGADTDAKAVVADGGGPVTALELCESLGEKEKLSELKRLASTQKATAKVMAEHSSSARDSSEGDGAAQPEVVTSVEEVDEELAARIREEAKAERKRQKNREKKKKKKEQDKAKAAQAQEQQQQEQEEAAAAEGEGGAAAAAGGGGPATGFRVRAGGGAEAEGDVVPAYESLLDPMDIEIVMEQARCGAVSRERAVQALANHNGDAVEAILELEGAIDTKGNNLLLLMPAAQAPAPTPIGDDGLTAAAGGAADEGDEGDEGEGAGAAVNGYGTVAYDLAAEAQRLRAARMTDEAVGWEAGGSINAQGKDRPPPVAMKRNPVTGEMEEFHSEKLKDDLPEEEAEEGEIEVPVGDDY
jgi:NACalpha-BTF3-like transcription factor